MGSILAAQRAPKSRPRGGPDTLSDVHQSQIEKKKAPARFAHTLSTWRRCNLTVKTQVFLKILTSSLLSFLLVILAHEAFKNNQKLVSKTSQNYPKRSSISVECWKRFHNSFATILASQMASQKKSLRRPRGLQTRLLFNLASWEASRMDFGRQMEPLGLDLKQFLQLILG